MKPKSTHISRWGIALTNERRLSLCRTSGLIKWSVKIPEQIVGIEPGGNCDSPHGDLTEGEDLKLTLRSACK